MSDPTATPVPCPPCVTSQADTAQWFESQVHAHDDQLKSYIRGAFPSVSDVEDIAQESYLRIWKARALQVIHSPKAFLFLIARRVAIDQIRHEKISPIIPVRDLAALPVLEDRPSVLEALSDQEKLQLLSQAVADLPARMRQVFILHKVEGLTNPQVAEKLGLSEKTAENLSSRGIKRVRNFLHRRGIEHF